MRTLATAEVATQLVNSSTKLTRPTNPPYDQSAYLPGVDSEGKTRPGLRASWRLLAFLWHVATSSFAHSRPTRFGSTNRSIRESRTTTEV